jgi:hypothetical protein
MLKSKYLVAIALIIELVLVGYLGYNIGLKETVEAKFDPKINIILDNGNQENSLTRIQIREITGSTDSKVKQSFGKFYFVTKNQDAEISKQANKNTNNQPSKINPSTDILFKMDSIPLKITNADISKEIPLELDIDLAMKTNEGLDFEYQNIGKIKFGINEKKQLKGDFSGVLDFVLDDKNIKNVQRIVFRSPVNPNIYQDTDTNLPIKVRGDKGRGITGEPAPYFWVDI